MLSDIKYWLLLSMDYLHFSLIENIFAFVNRSEDRSDVLYTVRNYFTVVASGFDSNAVCLQREVGTICRS